MPPGEVPLQLADKKTDRRKQHMNHLAHTAKDATRAEYKRWVDSRSFEEIQIANRARRALQRRETKPKGVRTKWPIIEDERQPKQNMTAYTFFVSSRAKSGDFQNMKIVDVAPLIGKEWAALSEDEKAVRLHDPVIQFTLLVQTLIIRFTEI